MKRVTRFQGCSLTLYFRDRSEIVAELTNASWIEEENDAEVKHLLLGLAGDGSVDFIARAIASGIDTVAYDFETPEAMYQGTAIIDKPGQTGTATTTEITVESHEAPALVTKDFASPGPLV